MYHDHSDAPLTKLALRIGSLIASVTCLMIDFNAGGPVGIPISALGMLWILMSFVPLPMSRQGAEAVNAMRCVTAFEALIAAVLTVAYPGSVGDLVSLAGLCVCLVAWILLHLAWTDRDADALAKHGIDGLARSREDDLADLEGMDDLPDLDDSEEWVESYERAWGPDTDLHSSVTTVKGSNATGPTARLDRVRQICLALPEPRRLEIDLAIDRCRRLIELDSPEASRLEGMKSISALDEVLSSYDRAARIADQNEISPLAEQVGEAVESAAKVADLDRRSLLRAASEDLQRRTRYLAYKAPGALDEDV